MSVLLPGAHDLDRYWSNLLQRSTLSGKSLLSGGIGVCKLDAEKTSADKIYSKWGGFLDELPFDPTEFGIPPPQRSSLNRCSFSPWKPFVGP
mgnify:CR=1 FL=1